MTGAAWEYIAVFAASLAIAFVITPFAVKLAEHRGILDHPGDNKAHESPVPYLGGVAMVVALSLAVMIAAVARPPKSGSEELIVVLAIAIALSVVGLVDDLRGLG